MINLEEQYSPLIMCILGNKYAKSPLLLLNISLNLQTRPTKFLKLLALRFFLPFLGSKINKLVAGRLTPSSNVEVVTIYLIAGSSLYKYSIYFLTFSGTDP